MFCRGRSTFQCHFALRHWSCHQYSGKVTDSCSSGAVVVFKCDNKQDTRIMLHEMSLVVYGVWESGRQIWTLDVKNICFSWIHLGRFSYLFSYLPCILPLYKWWSLSWCCSVAHLRFTCVSCVLQCTGPETMDTDGTCMGHMHLFFTAVNIPNYAFLMYASPSVATSLAHCCIPSS